MWVVGYSQNPDPKSSKGSFGGWTQIFTGNRTSPMRTLKSTQIPFAASYMERLPFHGFGEICLESGLFARTALNDNLILSA